MISISGVPLNQSLIKQELGSNALTQHLQSRARPSKRHDLHAGRVCMRVAISKWPRVAFVLAWEWVRGAIICSAHAGVHSSRERERERVARPGQPASLAACTSSQIISQGGMREWSVHRLSLCAELTTSAACSRCRSQPPQLSAPPCARWLYLNTSKAIFMLAGSRNFAAPWHSLPAGHGRRALVLSCLPALLPRSVRADVVSLSCEARSLLSHPHTHVTPPFLFSALVSLTDCHWSKAGGAAIILPLESQAQKSKLLQIPRSFVRSARSSGK